MNYIFLDIETVPLEIKHEDIKTYFMDNKITKESRAFNPNYSKIISICVKKLDGECEIFYGDEEEEILSKFVKFLEKNKDAVFITYNGYGFDVPFLNVRMALNKLSLPISINTNKWSMDRSNHFDVMLFLSQGVFTNTRLDIVAKMHGIEFSEERILGKEVERFYKKGDWEIINKHCKQDVELLEDLFKRVFI